MTPFESLMETTEKDWGEMINRNICIYACVYVCVYII